MERVAQVKRNDKAVLVYSTFPTIDTAEQAAASLVDSELAACVNIIPGMTSIYVWQGKRHRDDEVVMLIKTRATLADRAIAAARKLHPYDNPAFLVLPVEGGSAPFLAWIMEQTRATGT